jgi:hypothetical protein
MFLGWSARVYAAWLTEPRKRRTLFQKFDFVFGTLDPRRQWNRMPTLVHCRMRSSYLFGALSSSCTTTLTVHSQSHRQCDVAIVVATPCILAAVQRPKLFNDRLIHLEISIDAELQSKGHGQRNSGQPGGPAAPHPSWRRAPTAICPTPKFGTLPAVNISSQFFVPKLRECVNERVEIEEIVSRNFFL